jgi:hypothetical protein
MMEPEVLVITLLQLLFLLAVCPAGSNGPLHAPGKSAGPSNANQLALKATSQQYPSTGGASSKPPAVDPAHSLPRICFITDDLWQYSVKACHLHQEQCLLHMDCATLQNRSM